MLKREIIEEILAQYKKFGWHLRKILLSEKSKSSLSEEDKKIFGDTEIISSDFEAAWFTRDSGKANSAWELRHLSENPFAIFEVFPREKTEEELSSQFQEMENRLQNRLRN